MTARKGTRLRGAAFAVLLLLAAGGIASAQASQPAAPRQPDFPLQPEFPDQSAAPGQSVSSPDSSPDSPQSLPPAPEPVSLPAPQPDSHTAQQAKPKPPSPPGHVGSCELQNAAATMAATAAVRADSVAENDGPALSAPPRIVGITLCVPHVPVINWYARFVNGPAVQPLTPLQKAHLAGRNVVDPFNLITIIGEAGIATAWNSHSIYGPGWNGFAKNVGVSFTQSLVGEFIGTFLIPSVTHEDPRYHRMPNATIKRRAFHCIEQVFWTLGDDGKGMPNYSNLVGFAGEAEIDNLYVPGQQTNLPATAKRYATALAIAPADNAITEFVPDIARHIRVQVVLVQRIINQVARTGSAAPAQ